MNLTVWEANRRAWHVYQKVRFQRLVPSLPAALRSVGVLTVDLVGGKVGYVITQTTPKQFNDPEILDPAEYPNGDSDGYLMWKDLL